MVGGGVCRGAIAPIFAHKSTAHILQIAIAVPQI